MPETKELTLFIELVSREDADGLTAEIYEAEEERWGFLPEFVQAFSLYPEAYQAWLTLVRTVYGSMDRRRCELATLAAAKQLKVDLLFGGSRQDAP